MIIAMSPMGDIFRSRLRMFPSLVNNCTIDFFAPWPEEALRSVAKNTLDTMDLKSDLIKEGIIQMCGRIHQSVEAASVSELERSKTESLKQPGLAAAAFQLAAAKAKYDRASAAKAEDYVFSNSELERILF